MGNYYPSLNPFEDDLYLKSTLGFDRMISILQNVSASRAASTATAGFPPTNLIKKDENNYTIEIAVAGYKQNEIEITSQQNSLRIVGKKEEKDERTYVQKGIAGRNFAKEFTLADTVVVRDAELSDGILSVHLENIIPEEKKPRKIEIKQQLPALEQ